MEKIGGGGRECGVCWLNAAGKSEGRRRGGPSLGAGPGRDKVGPRRPSPAGHEEKTGTSEGFWQASRSDECLPRPPSARPPLRAEGWDAARRVAPLRTPGCACRAAPSGPAGAVPSVPPQTRRGRRGRAGRPGAGGDRRLLAAAVPPSPRVGAGERQPSPWRCRGEMLLRDAA